MAKRNRILLLILASLLMISCTSVNQQTSIVNLSDTHQERSLPSLETDDETYHRAFTNQDLSICKEISLDLLANNCINEVITQIAISANDPSICQQIENLDDQAHCLEKAQ